MLCSQIPFFVSFVFPMPFLTEARFQLHLAALSQALQAHGALLLHGYSSQPYTQTGFVFNFLINTLYIKEKGLQFAVSTQRARGKRRKKKKRKKQRLKNLNHKGQRGEKGLKLQSQIPMSSGIPGSDEAQPGFQPPTTAGTTAQIDISKHPRGSSLEDKSIWNTPVH